MRVIDEREVDVSGSGYHPRRAAVRLDAALEPQHRGLQLTRAASAGGSRFLEPAVAGEGAELTYTPRHVRAVTLPPELQRALDEAFAPIPRRLMAGPIPPVEPAPSRVAPAESEPVEALLPLDEPHEATVEPQEATVEPSPSPAAAIELVEDSLAGAGPDEATTRAHLTLVVAEPPAVTVGPPEPAPQPPTMDPNAQHSFVASGFPHPAEYAARHAAGGAMAVSAWFRS